MTAVIAGIYDVVGVGIGPFNLSTAALLDGIPHVSSVFFDDKEAFKWHPGLLFRDARLQTSFLKDLVSFADPSNPHSFLNFLHAHRRLHQFINAEFDRVTRAEFSEYLAWVASRLPNLRFARQVEELRYRDGLFIVRLQPNIEVLCKHAIVGVGRRPKIPACAKPHLGASVFHAGEFLDRMAQAPQPRAVTIVGGGQSAAEIFLHCMRSDLPLTSLTWLTRRRNFAPLDESPFANEYFTPLYSRHFHALDLEGRLDALGDQKLASDGISPATLREVYQEIYRAKFIERRDLDLRLLVDHEFVALDRVGAEWCSTVIDRSTRERSWAISDLVVLASGYEAAVPGIIEGIAHLFETEHGQVCLERDFSARWRSPCNNRLYLQNAAQQSHGIADPNLSLMAWRSATIINSLLGREHFLTPQSEQFIEWKIPQSPQQLMEQIV